MSGMCNIFGKCTLFRSDAPFMGKPPPSRYMVSLVFNGFPSVASAERFRERVFPVIAQYAERYEMDGGVVFWAPDGLPAADVCVVDEKTGVISVRFDGLGMDDEKNGLRFQKNLWEFFVRWCKVNEAGFEDLPRVPAGVWH